VVFAPVQFVTSDLPFAAQTAVTNLSTPTDVAGDDDIGEELDEELFDRERHHGPPCA
jgi:hypothetical protein